MAVGLVIVLITISANASVDGDLRGNADWSADTLGLVVRLGHEYQEQTQLRRNDDAGQIPWHSL